MFQKAVIKRRNADSIRLFPCYRKRSQRRTFVTNKSRPKEPKIYKYVLLEPMLKFQFKLFAGIKKILIGYDEPFSPKFLTKPHQVQSYKLELKKEEQKSSHNEEKINRAFVLLNNSSGGLQIFINLVELQSGINEVQPGLNGVV